MKNEPVAVAILGFGTVGSGLKEILDTIPDKAKLVGVLELPSKQETLGSLYYGNLEELLDQNKVDTVFECMGGDEFACRCICSCLSRGINVITSNKEVVAKHLYEFLQLAKAHDCSFLFEASVGGTIPLIKPLMELSKFDEVSFFEGILNGTCNYLLTKIFRDGLSMEKALLEARQKGFAEANPHADLSGEDLKRKGIILANLCFQQQVDYDEVSCFGIESLSLRVIDYLKAHHQILKMMVKGKRSENGISLIVEPTILEEGDFASYVQDEYNSLEVHSKYHGRLQFVGKGAGRLPTAAAMVDDWMACLDGGIAIDLGKEKAALYFEKGEYLVEDSSGIHLENVMDFEDLKGKIFVAKIEKRQGK